MVDAIRCLGSTISHHIIEDTCPGLPNEGEDLISEFRIIKSKGMFTPRDIMRNLTNSSRNTNKIITLERLGN